MSEIQNPKPLPEEVLLEDDEDDVCIVEDPPTQHKAAPVAAESQARVAMSAAVSCSAHANVANDAAHAESAGQNGVCECVCERECE